MANCWHTEWLSGKFEGHFLARCSNEASSSCACEVDFFFWTHIRDFTFMPIKFHPVVFDLKWKQEDSLISSDSASTEALSLEELQSPRNYRVQRSQTLRAKKVMATAVGASASSALCLPNTRTRETALITRVLSRGGKVPLSKIKPHVQTVVINTAPFQGLYCIPPHTVMCFISST